MDLSLLEQYQQDLVTILETENTTLEYAKIGRDHPSVTEVKINYYTLLNQHDRAAARNPDTELDEFVSLLLSPQQQTPSLSSVESSNALYGLLRELPTLWCSGS